MLSYPNDTEEGLDLPKHVPEKSPEGEEDGTSMYTRFTRLSLLRPLRIGSPTRTKQPLKDTAYLDGLRGFAALLVYCTHHHAYAHETDAQTQILNNGFGWNHEYYLVTFPGLRVIFSGGHTAVAIFFAISGYVLSVAPLRYIHERDLGGLASSMGSALFRRWLRLYIPIIVTTLAWLTTWHILKIQSGKYGAPGPESTYLDELWKWYCDFKNFSFVYKDNFFNEYNFHLWTIPLEFRGSIVTYTALIAFARFKTNARLCCEAALIYYFLYIVDGYYCALFATGVLLRDLDMLSQKDQLPEFLSRLRPSRNWVYYVLLLLSIHLAGVPSASLDVASLRESPGWYTLSFLKPQAFFDYRWFFRYWAGIFAMVAIPRLPWLRRFFEGTFCQYLGKVSYGFYLIHGPVLWSLGDRLYAASGCVRPNSDQVVPDWVNLFPLSSWGPFGLEINFLLPHLILLPFTLWLASLVTKLVDEPSVRFGQWLYNRCVEPKVLR